MEEERRFVKWSKWSVIWTLPASIAALMERDDGAAGMDEVTDGVFSGRLRLRGGGLMALTSMGLLTLDGSAT
jgi:hypothetical protein